VSEQLETRPLDAPAAGEAEPPGTAATAAPARPSLTVGLIRGLRPKQWAKNTLVAAAPGAAGVLTEGPVLADVALGIVAFCLVSSGTYYLNDVRDLEADRLHPDKRHRPIAAGVVPIRLAVVVAIALMAAGLGLAALVSLGFLGVVVGYLALTTSYSMWLKHIAVIDIVAIASGFIMRAIAGGVAADVPLSRWFVIVASFGSLFVVSGKRHGEHIDLGAEGHEVRPTLGAYSRNYLQYVWTMTSGVTLTAYCLWAFEQSPDDTSIPFFELSIVPFACFILRYALLLDQGRGGAPEDIVLSDRTLQALTVVWIVIFGCAVQFR
jgi:decaprenyl-phosphate phosphoribosyltransferase